MNVMVAHPKPKPWKKHMSDEIDRRIAGLEKELAGLRRQKLAGLQSQVAALEASLGSTAEPVTRRRGRPPGKAAAGPAKRGRPAGSGKGWAAALSTDPEAFTGAPRKRRGRKRGKHIGDADALAMLTKVVTATGKEGISARKAAQTSGIFYPRAISLMDKNFKKSGSGKWTRYTSK